MPDWICNLADSKISAKWDTA